MNVYAIVGALIVGLTLGLLGSGGAILTVPILVFLLDHPEKAAIAESLAIVAAIALVGAIRGYRAGNTELRTVVSFGIPSMGGAIAGSTLAPLLPGEVQLVILSIVMLTAAALMLRSPAANAAPRRHPVALLAAQGIGVGVITGLVGVGGGFLIVPALVLLGGLPMKRAVPTSLAIITLNALSGFLTHLRHSLHGDGPSLEWGTIGLFIALGVTGSLAGSALGSRMNQRLLRRVFSVFLVGLAAYILWQKLPEVLGI